MGFRSTNNERVIHGLSYDFENSGTADLEATKAFIEKDSKAAAGTGVSKIQRAEDGPRSMLRKDGISQSLELHGSEYCDGPLFPSLRPQMILECPFDFLLCFMTFSGLGDWISHSLTHFGNVEPPRLNVCCFCGAFFEPSTGLRSWTDHMKHVASHHALGERRASARPSLDLFRYLWEHRLITDAEYRTLVEKYGRPLPTREPGKKDKAPAAMNERVNRTGLVQLEQEDPMSYIREEIEHNVSTFPKDYQNTTFAIRWDLFKYVRRELEEDQNLARILTVSGTAKKAYSTTCADYVCKLWPKTGLWMLKILQTVIDREVYRKLSMSFYL